MIDPCFLYRYQCVFYEGAMLVDFVGKQPS